MTNAELATDAALLDDHREQARPLDKSRLKHALAVTMGAAIEYYDFVVYTFFAVMIGRAFFPSENPVTSLLLSLSTFAAGSLMRPIGGIFLGGYADRRGRKKALLLSIILMTIGTMGIGLTPSYEAIGVVAPVILVIARMLQGFAMGGEVGAAATYIVEIAPPHRRYLYMGMKGAFQSLGTILAGVIGFSLASLLPEAALDQWGWRVPFMVSLLIIPVGLYVRRSLPETLVAGASERKGLPFIVLMRDHFGVVAKAILAFGALSITVYVVMYATTFAISVLKLPADIAMVGTIASGVVSLISALGAGALADRYGARPICVLPMSLSLVLPYPAFLWLVAEPNVVTLCIATAMIGAPAFMSALALLALLPKLLPEEVRVTGVAFAWAMATSVFGGTAQLVVTWLMDHVQSPYVPAFYVMGANLVGLIAIASISASRKQGSANP